MGKTYKILVNIIAKVKIPPHNPKVPKSPYPFFSPITYKIVEKKPEVKKEKIYRIMRFNTGKLFAKDKDTFGKCNSIVNENGEIRVKRYKDLRKEKKKPKKNREDFGAGGGGFLLGGILDELDNEEAEKAEITGVKSTQRSDAKNIKKKKRWKKKKDAVPFWNRDITQLEKIGGIYDNEDEFEGSSSML